MQKKTFTGHFVAAGVLLNVGIAPSWAADLAGSGSSAANRPPAQIAQAASDQPPPAAGEKPAAAEEQPAAPTAMTTPTMVGPLAANPNPISFDAGPLGPVYMTGVVSALGLWQNNKFPGDQNSLASLSNGQFIFQKTDGLFQYFVQAGAYTLPALGTPYVNTPKATGDFYSALPQAFIKLAPTDTFSIQAGKLPTLIGAEYTFTFENMNIERGLLWNQENAVNRGVQLNYAADPLDLRVFVERRILLEPVHLALGLVSLRTQQREHLVSRCWRQLRAYNEGDPGNSVIPKQRNNLEPDLYLQFRAVDDHPLFSIHQRPG